MRSCFVVAHPLQGSMSCMFSEWLFEWPSSSKPSLLIILHWFSLINRLQTLRSHTAVFLKHSNQPIWNLQPCHPVVRITEITHFPGSGVWCEHWVKFLVLFMQYLRSVYALFMHCFPGWLEWTGVQVFLIKWMVSVHWNLFSIFHLKSFTLPVILAHIYAACVIFF